jgi:hypothetical protein
MVQKKRMQETGDPTYLAYGFEGTRGDFQSHVLSKRIREESFGLDVGEPRPTCLFLREWNVVAVLLCLSMEEAQL